MIIEHNITKDRFERIEYDTESFDFPSETFQKQAGEGDIITRIIPMSAMPYYPNRLVIKAFRVFSENNVEYRKSYTFTFVPDSGKTGSFDDEYVHIDVCDGRLLKPKISKPTLKNKGLDKIIQYGYDAAQDNYETLMYYHEEEPDSFPFDENGFPEIKRFCDVMNDVLWEIGFDIMEETPSLRNVLHRCGTDAAENAFFNGVYKFIDEHCKKPESHDD